MSGSPSSQEAPTGRRSFLEAGGLAGWTLCDLLASRRPLLGAERPGDAEAAPSTPRPAAGPAARLVPWMYMIYPLEQWLDDYRRTFDAWAEGGVRGLVIGPLVFYKEPPRFDFTYARPGVQFPVFPADPAVYRRRNLDPPPAEIGRAHV